MNQDTLSSEDSRMETSSSLDEPIDLFVEDGLKQEEHMNPTPSAASIGEPDRLSIFLADGDASATEDLILCEPSDAQCEARSQTLDDLIAADMEEPHVTIELADEAEPLILRNDQQDEEKADNAQSNVIDKPMPELPAPGEIAKLGKKRTEKIPRQIGKGTLVPARLTWKPGDPFGEGRKPTTPRFHWERMLTSACITAACGMLGVWLLRSLLA